MALLRNSDQTIRRFIGDIIEDVVGNRTQLRLTREELLKLLISFSKRNRLEGDSRATLDEWLLSLNHSVFYKDYVVKYIPVVDALSFQWVPPWENMVWASEIRNANLKQDLCESITEMTFGEFEYLMRQVFIRTGWASDIAVTKASQDDGIDFHGKYIGEPSGLVLPLVGQAKHWKTKVGSEEIRTFLGSIAIRNDHRNVVGVYVSTSGFTEKAQEMIRKAPNQIIPFDIGSLAEMMITKKIGVSKMIIKGTGLDSGFWNDLHA